MLTDNKKQMFVRALAGGLTGVVLLLAFVYVFDAMPFLTHTPLEGWHSVSQIGLW